MHAFRERGQREANAPTYVQAWQCFGGSVATRPLAVEQFVEMAGIPVCHLGWKSAGELVAAVSIWGRHLASSKNVFKRRGKKGLYDLGNAEPTLPVADDTRIALRRAGRYLSALHERNIVTLRPQTERLALARVSEDFSRKLRYDQRRRVHLVEEVGGQVRQTDSFTPAEFVAIYLELFQRRWGSPAAGVERVVGVLERLRELLYGSVLLLNDQPVAVQAPYRVEVPGWLDAEYINGGVDPQTREPSPDNVFNYLGTQAVWEDVRVLGKPLRYSFGHANRGYKDRWCRSSPISQA